METNEDEHLIKCRRTKNCVSTSPKKSYKEVSDPKSAICKNTKALMQEADPQKVKEEQEAIEDELKDLRDQQKEIDAMNVKYKNAGRKPYDTDELKHRISELEKH